MSRAFSKFRSSDLGKESPAITGDMVWLDMRRDTVRWVRAFTYVVLAAVLISCVVVGLQITERVAAPVRFVNVALFVLYLSPLLVLLWAIPYFRSLSWIALSLGTDGRCFSLRDRHSRVVASAPIGEVRTDGEYLLLGRRLVPLQHVYRPAYDMDRLRIEFIGRLPAGAFMSRNVLLWHALRAGNHGLILVVLVICIAVGWKVIK